MYRIFKDMAGSPAVLFDFDTNTSFFISVEQPLYQNFKTQILADEAELQDADGVLMSPEEAKAFVKELP